MLLLGYTHVSLCCILLSYLVMGYALNYYKQHGRWKIADVPVNLLLRSGQCVIWTEVRVLRVCCNLVSPFSLDCQGLSASPKMGLLGYCSLT